METSRANRLSTLDVGNPMWRHVDDTPYVALSAPMSRTLDTDFSEGLRLASTAKEREQQALDRFLRFPAKGNTDTR